MLSFPDLSGILKGLKSGPLEDVGDQLNHFVTVFLIFFFFIVTGSKQHFGKPISCMNSGESNVEHWMNYFHDFCYVSQKYHVTDHERLATTRKGAAGVGNAGMAYYQWVPYLLMLQIILFFCPKVFWTSASHNYGNGRDMESFVENAVKIHAEYGLKRQNKVKEMCGFLKDGGILGGRRDALLYTLMKWACVMNALGQLYFMSWFIADWNINWAYELVQHLYYDKTGSASPYFPRVSFCDVTKLQVGQSAPITFQCVLMFNFVNEKIFLILFGWVMFLLVVNVIGALRQTLLLICPQFRFWVAQLLLPSSSVLFRHISWTPVQSKHLFSFFIHDSLGCDGIFLIEAVSSHAGRIIAREIASELFAIVIKKKDDPGYKLSMDILPRPKILHLNEEDSTTKDDDIERRSLIPSTLDRRFSRSSPTISAPPYHSIFTESGRERDQE